jgi:hypothetical protein
MMGLLPLGQRGVVFDWIHDLMLFFFFFFQMEYIQLELDLKNNAVIGVVSLLRVLGAKL